jgi:hypothetical protein
MTTKLIQELVEIADIRSSEDFLSVCVKVIDNRAVSIRAYRKSKVVYDEFFHLNSLYQEETKQELQAAIDNIKEL